MNDRHKNTFESDQTAGLLFLLVSFLVSGEKHISFLSKRKSE
jgi:hypothetical protein